MEQIFLAYDNVCYEMSVDQFSAFSLGFRHPFTNSEALDVVEFLSLIQNIHVSYWRRDTRLWSPGSSRSFPCSSYFWVLSSLPAHLPFFAFSSIWKLRTPRKV